MKGQDTLCIDERNQYGILIRYEKRVRLYTAL